MVILYRIITKIFFGLILFFFIFSLFYNFEKKKSVNHDRFQNYLETIQPRSNLNDKSSVNDNIILQYVTWLKEMVTIRKNWGLDNNGMRYIYVEIKKTIPFTLILVGMTIFFIVNISLILCYILTSDIPFKIKSIIDTILEIFSSIPEFIFCFLLIRPFPVFITTEYADLYVNLPENFNQILIIMYYMILPVIALAFANGSVSNLTKYLVNRIIAIKKSQFYVFLEANGTKNFYLKYFVILKDILPLIIRYIVMKFPLIIGSSIVIERIFDIQGLSNKAFQTFRVPDYGYILAILFIIYLINVFLEIIAYSFDFVINPERKKIC